MLSIFQLQVHYITREFYISGEAWSTLPEDRKDVRAVADGKLSVVSNASFLRVNDSGLLCEPHLDEKQPICARCERHGLECSGVRGTVFIDSSQAFTEPAPKKAAPARKRRSAASKALPAGEVNPAVPTTMDLTAFRDMFCIAFTRKFLLRGGPVHLAMNVIDFDKPNHQFRLVRDALLSLANIFFGNQHRDSGAKHKGYQLYGATIKALNQSLSDPEQAKTDDVLLCVITFGLLETFVPSGQVSWLMHIRGMERLLELRGPEAHHNAFSRQIVQGIRRLLIFGSLNTSIPSIVSRPEWKALEWKSDAIQENTDEDLLNILADCPALFNRRDELIDLCDSNKGDAASRLQKRILEEGSALLEDLKTWRECWGEGLQDAMSERSDSHPEFFSAPSISGDLPITTWAFGGPAAATTMMLYFSIHIYILDLMSSISILPPCPLKIVRQQTLDPHVFPVDLGPAAPYHFDVIAKQRHYIKRLQTAALNICRIVPYHLSIRDKLDAGSLHIGALSINVAWKAFQGEATVEGKWLKDTILNHKSDLPFAKGVWGKEGDEERPSQDEEDEE